MRTSGANEGRPEGLRILYAQHGQCWSFHRAFHHASQQAHERAPAHGVYPKVALHYFSVIM